MMVWRIVLAERQPDLDTNDTWVFVAPRGKSAVRR